MKIKISKEDRKKILKFLFAKPRVRIFILIRLLYQCIVFLLKNPDILIALKEGNEKEIIIQDSDDKVIILQEDIAIIFYKSAKDNIINFVNTEKGNVILNFLKAFQKEKSDGRIILPEVFPFNIFFELNISEIAEKFLPALG